jgi:choline monooxygenase
LDISQQALHVDPKIARAWSLRAPLYTDASVFAAEKERIFSRTWQVVGHGSQVAKPGDYLTAELMGEPRLLVRGNDGTLRGFYNVCRHRAGLRWKAVAPANCFAAVTAAGPTGSTVP